MKTNYTKMQSNGNDFLITEDSNLIEKTAELSDRIKNLMQMVQKQIIV